MKPIKGVSRRDFVRYAAQVGISAVALEGLIIAGNRIAQAAASGSAEHEQSGPYWAMVIDLETCVGCNFCSYACKATNDTADGVYWNAVFSDKENFSKEVFIPRPCMHCEHAPCVEVCLVGATYHRPDGLVAMDYDKCIGCRYCQAACPYGARYFNWEQPSGPTPMATEWGNSEVKRRPRGVVEKCTFCAHRIDAGLAQGLTPGKDRAAAPACCNICPVGARVFGDLNDPDSQVSKLLASRESMVLREETGVHPRVFYLLPERSA